MKKKFCVTIIVVVLFFLIVPTSARFIKNIIRDFILKSQNFYFESSTLSVDGKTHNITDWDGVNPYTIVIDVNNKKNEIVSTKSDIKYETSINCPSSVTCSVSKKEGIIYSLEKTDSYTITIVPNDKFLEGDSVTITSTAKSVYPYTKQLTATYIISVQNYGFSYNTIDSSGSKFLTLDLTNSKPYYEVLTPFLQYSKGDYISLDKYIDLNEEDKKKCVSIRVKISFDPNIVLLDLTNDVYLNNVNYTTKTITDNLYVDSITFDVDANSNKKIKFFKEIVNTDYSNQNIIKVEVIKI